MSLLPPLAVGIPWDLAHRPDSGVTAMLAGGNVGY
jgi:hypothetical protein